MAAKKGKNELALWDEQLAQYAEKQAAQEQVRGKWFSTQAGQLSFNDQPVPGNKMGVIIIDNIFENAFYPGKFTPGAIVAPECFALNRDEDALAPHELSADPQHEKCEGCPMNAWGSADTGRGKACGNRRRLALLPAGHFDKAGDFEAIYDPKHYASIEPGFLKLPSTSIKGWATYVKQLAQTLKRPPFGVITQIEVVPDSDTQFKIEFTALTAVPNEIMGAIMERRKAMELSNEIAFPYEPVSEQQSKPAPRGGNKAAKHSARAAPAKAAPVKTAPRVKAPAKPATPAAATKAPKVKAAASAKADKTKAKF